LMRLTGLIKPWGYKHLCHYSKWHQVCHKKESHQDKEHYNRLVGCRESICFLMLLTLLLTLFHLAAEGRLIGQSTVQLYFLLPLWVKLWLFRFFQAWTNISVQALKSLEKLYLYLQKQIGGLSVHCVTLCLNGQT